MSDFTYVSYHHHAPQEWECDTLQEAIEHAISSLDGDDDWPSEIRRGKTVLWEQEGQLTTSASLKRFAAKHGVQWRAE